MKMLSTLRAGRVNGLKRLVEGILRQILTLFPIASQTIDRMENQLAVFLNECFDRLSG